MIILLIVAAAATSAGAVVYSLVRRWPAPISAPRVDPSTIRHEVRRRPLLRRLLRTSLAPEAEGSLLLTVAIAGVIAAAVAVGILVTMIRARWGLAGLDGPLARFAAAHATGLSTSVMRDVSQLGGWVGLTCLMVVVGAIEYRRIPNRAIPFFLVLTVLGQFAVANLIKTLVDRARPSVDRLTGFAGSSFPSGHAVASAAGFAAFALLMGRRRSLRARAALTGAAAGIATAVGASRIFLGVHWFTDVIAGLCVGWGWFALCSMAFGGRLLRFAAPVMAAEAETERVVGAADSEPRREPRLPADASGNS